MASLSLLPPLASNYQQTALPSPVCVFSWNLKDRVLLKDNKKQSKSLNVSINFFDLVTMLASATKTGRKRLQSTNASRSPLNAVSKEYNYQKQQQEGFNMSQPQTVSKSDQPLRAEVSQKLSVMSHSGAVPCLPFAGEELSGLDCSPLPYTR